MGDSWLESFRASERDFLLEREHDEYARQLDELCGFKRPDDPLPVGRARCVECGRNDLLSVSTTDGRRVLLDATGDGRWQIRNGLARIVATGGDHSDHTCGGTR